MKTSDSQSNLVPALFAAKGEFPRIAKNKEGQSGNRKFRYAPLDEIMDHVDPVLRKNGLMLTQGTEGHELITRLEHISTEWREVRMPINAEHANMQSYGIEVTYRRRYSVQLILGIVTEEDIDIRAKERRKGKDFTEERNENGTKRAFDSAHKPTDGAGQGISEERLSELDELALHMIDCHKNGKDMEAIRLWYGNGTFASDNDPERDGQEERKYVWKQLAKESKLRSIINANNPRHAKQEQAATH